MPTANNGVTVGASGSKTLRFLSAASLALTEPCSVHHVIDNDDYGKAALTRGTVGNSRRPAILQGLCAKCRVTGSVGECWHCGALFCVRLREASK